MTLTVPSAPRPFTFDVRRTALLIIDMQHDFLSPGGYVGHSGADVGMLRKAIEPTRRVLDAARRVGMLVIFTREGHRPGLEDCYPAKLERTDWVGHTIGKPGPLGRLLVKGSKGHEIIEEIRPLATETIVDKPGKGAFYATDLDVVLRARGVTHLVFTGVTINICVENTMREAADRGYYNLVVSDATAAISPEIHEQSVKMIMYQGGVFGQVAPADALLEALAAAPG